MAWLTASIVYWWGVFVVSGLVREQQKSDAAGHPIINTSAGLLLFSMLWPWFPLLVWLFKWNENRK